jgi:hypothetical protein
LERAQTLALRKLAVFAVVMLAVSVFRFKKSVE